MFFISNVLHSYEICTCNNVWCIKFRSKHSSNTVLCLHRNLMHQTLLCNLYCKTWLLRYLSFKKGLVRQFFVWGTGDLWKFWTIPLDHTEPSEVPCSFHELTPFYKLCILDLEWLQRKNSWNSAVCFIEWDLYVVLLVQNTIYLCKFSILRLDSFAIWK